MYYTHTVNPIGCFTEKDHGQYFEYSDMTWENIGAQSNLGGPLYEESFENPWNWPHMVWVGDTAGGGQGWRHAKVLKTVAYVVTDEDDYGMPVVEKWKLKKNNEYICN